MHNRLTLWSRDSRKAAAATVQSLTHRQTSFVSGYHCRAEWRERRDTIIIRANLNHLYSILDAKN